MVPAPAGTLAKLFSLYGPIYNTTGTYLGAIYDPNQVVINQVRTGTFRFNNLRVQHLFTQ